MEQFLINQLFEAQEQLVDVVKDRTSLFHLLLVRSRFPLFTFQSRFFLDLLKIYFESFECLLLMY